MGTRELEVDSEDGLSVRPLVAYEAERLDGLLRTLKETGIHLEDIPESEQQPG